MKVELMDQAADLLSVGRLELKRMGGLPDPLRPGSEAEAYAIQELLHSRYRRAGLGPRVGYKIGCTTAVMQKYLGIDNPCAGGVFGSTVRRESGVFEHGRFLHVGVECELAVSLGCDLKSEGLLHDRETVVPAVESVMAAIEVVDDRWVDYSSIDTATLIADDFFGSACVLGEPVTEWSSIDLQGIGGSMYVNGEQLGSGRGADILGHPLEALAWLANSLEARGSYLRAGEFVLLGSLVQTRWMQRNDLVQVDIDGLGKVKARFR